MLTKFLDPKYEQVEKRINDSATRRCRYKAGALLSLQQLEKNRSDLPKELRLLSVRNELRLHARLLPPYLFIPI
jgi:hypothetical protein